MLQLKMEWMARLGEWADRLPTPRAILIVSAHWESAPLTLSGPEAGTPVVYDFGGFAERFYRMTYATPDASALAARVAGALPDGQPVHTSRRGLDHGAWVPLTVMYPLGDVPVLQTSLPTEDPDRLLALGARLRELRGEGVLVVGSGFMTHGLPFLTRDHDDRRHHVGLVPPLPPGRLNGPGPRPAPRGMLTAARGPGPVSRGVNAMAAPTGAVQGAVAPFTGDAR
jgi:aromatic ring-opening dioxygenase catalytic subunit (LigB family)